MSEALFCPGYHADRTAFFAELERFVAATGRSVQHHRLSVDAQQDLTVSIAELPARERPDKVYVVCCGIHGVEGYAGSAIMRALLKEHLAKLDPATTGILLVHALNPYGFHHYIRVNQNNVDLNRNCAAHGEALFGSNNTEFEALRGLLGPSRPCSLALKQRLRFYLGIGQALATSGTQTMRQATLAGQYVDPRGVFYGGAHVEPEIAFFQEIYARIAHTYGEVLLTDLHTGYGVRGQAYPLFGRADSEAFRHYVEGGVKDGSTDKTYTVSGDLVGYCYKTSKRLRPAGIFNGVVIEIGTHGLSMRDQLADLQIVISENQLRHYGAVDDATAEAVRANFRELFSPQPASWRRKAVEVGVETSVRLLSERAFL
ncbi:MAG TPA: M14 family metallopeptidase [Polyangiales bacterium]|nr:M14 family metallopeptidase [Polyangiales bacterium]